MKKSFKWGIRHYFKPTPAKVKKWLTAWKGIIGGTAFTAMADNNWKLAVAIGIVGFCIAELTEFIAEHYDEDGEDKGVVKSE